MLARVRLLALLACAVVLSALPAAARAAAPANDAFSNAAPLAAGPAVLGNNLGATAEGAEPSPSSNAVRPDCAHVTDAASCASSVWYSFHAPTTANYTIDDCDLGTDLNGIVSVWNGTGLGSLSLAPSEANTFCSSAGSGVSFDATAGQTYWVDVEGYQAQQGAFYVRAYPTSSSPSAGGPDTLIDRKQSLAYARLELNNASSYGNEVQSGPRQTASFDFTSDTAGASFECSLDGAAFSACSSPVSYDGLDSGEHIFEVRAVANGASDPTPAVQIFNIDDTPPDTLISGPTGNLKVLGASWNLTTSDPTFEENYKCEFDSSVAYRCGNPGPAFSTLCAGPHELQAAAFDQANNVDATPAVASLNTEGGPGDDCGQPSLATVSAGATATQASVSTNLDPGGAGATLRLDWGRTTAYGSSVSTAVLPDDTDLAPSMLFLTPGTEYHYQLTLTSPFGTAVSGDLTFTTDSAGSELPDLSEGGPEVVGAHAVAIPINIDPHGSSISDYGVYIDDAPVTQASPFVDGLDKPVETTPFQRTLDVVDLAPNTTYHVRAYVFSGSGDAETSERTFTTGPPSSTPPGPPQPPPQPLPPVQPVPTPPLATHFRLRGAEVHLGRLRRGSKTVTLTVSGLPAGALVNVQLRAGVQTSAVKTLAKAHAKANAHGVAKLRLKLSKKARRLLHNRRLKTVTIRVAASLRHGKPSVVTLHKRLH